MGIKEIDISIMAEVIRGLPDGFCTRDVSEDQRMLARNAHVRGERNYHANVGRRISMERGRGGIPALRKGTSSARGQRWHFPTATDREAPSLPVSLPPVQTAVDSADDRTGLGPQSASDTAFRAAARLHQSRYRRDVLGLPHGTGPCAKSTTRYGNMLTAADAERGANFLSPEIFEVVKQRLAQGKDRVERFRLLHNMLSSQPMCFNLFGPLVRDGELACRLLEPIIGPLARVTDARIEYAPEPASAYLADRTSFDAFFAYERPDGARGFLGIETKYTEPFSQRVEDHPGYRRWMTPAAPWREDAAGQVAHIAHNQLWRDHLLAIALRDHPASPYAEGHLMLVRHPGDKECARVAQNYQALLRAGDGTFIDMPLDLLIQRWGTCASAAEGEWQNHFQERYLP